MQYGTYGNIIYIFRYAGQSQPQYKPMAIVNLHQRWVKRQGVKFYTNTIPCTILLISLQFQMLKVNEGFGSCISYSSDGLKNSGILSKEKSHIFGCQ